MVTTHKISAELYEDSFKLVAIHSSLNAHSMAYYMNKAANLRLKRALYDLDVNSFSFPFFEWEDHLNENNWVLICNTVKKIQRNESIGLFFGNDSERTHYLVQERKEVDYFLKIEADQESHIETIINTIKSIPSVVTAYGVDLNQLKSKRNLIF